MLGSIVAVVSGGRSCPKFARQHSNVQHPAAPHPGTRLPGRRRPHMPATFSADARGTARQSSSGYGGRSCGSQQLERIRAAIRHQIPIDDLLRDADTPTLSHSGK